MDNADIGHSRVKVTFCVNKQDLAVELSTKAEAVSDCRHHQTVSGLCPCVCRCVCVCVSEGKYWTTWKGVGQMKDALDLVIYMQLLWDLKPRTVFEIGSYAGGSALWMSDMLTSYGCDAHVYSVDISLKNVPPAVRDCKAITFIEGDVFKIDQIFPEDNIKVAHLAFIHNWKSNDCVGPNLYLLVPPSMPFIHLSIHRPTYLSIHPHPLIHPHSSIQPPTYPPTHQPIHPPAHPSIQPPTYPYIHPPLYPSIRPFTKGVWNIDLITLRQTSRSLPVSPCRTSLALGW